MSTKKYDRNVSDSIRRLPPSVRIAEEEEEPLIMVQPTSSNFSTGFPEEDQGDAVAMAKSLTGLIADEGSPIYDYLTEGNILGIPRYVIDKLSSNLNC